MVIDSKKYNGSCTCGRNHEMDTRLVVIEAGCLAHLEDYLQKVGLQGKKLCALYDSNTVKAKGLVKPPVAQEIVLEAEGLHADENATAKVLAKLQDDIEVLVAIGSGTVHDAARYCANERGIPFVACPTAATVDGFCSTVSAMTWHGFKKTMPGVAPLLVLADLDVIRQAPGHLALSGVGDIVGKYTALADWKITSALTGEFFCPRIEGMTRQAVETVHESATSLAGGSVDAFEKLTYALLLSGLAMQLMGNSRPASGAEHHISHLIEMEPVGLGVRSPGLHGEKVGVATLLLAAEYQRRAEIEDIAPHTTAYQRPSAAKLQAFFGERLIRDVIKENESVADDVVTPEAMAANWPAIREIIAEIPPASQLQAFYKAAGLKSTLADIAVPEAALPALLEYAPFVRSRLTFLRFSPMITL